MARRPPTQHNVKPTFKPNAVHKDIIHSENIRKEMKFFDKNRMEHFQLNPNNMVILADKPNHIKPQSQSSHRRSSAPHSNNEDIFGNHYTEDPVEEAFSNQKLEKTLQMATLVPRQKYHFPQTQSQEIGWFANQLNTFKPTRNHAIQQCEITTFVNTYYEMTKENPFKQKRT